MCALAVTVLACFGWHVFVLFQIYGMKKCHLWHFQIFGVSDFQSQDQLCLVPFAAAWDGPTRLGISPMPGGSEWPELNGHNLIEVSSGSQPFVLPGHWSFTFNSNNKITQCHWNPELVALMVYFKFARICSWSVQRRFSTICATWPLVIYM